MKIVTFKGGLGNQLYQYVFFKYLENKTPGHKIYGFYPSKDLSAHNGLEIEKWFDVHLPQASIIINMIGTIFYYLSKFVRKVGLKNNLINVNGYDIKPLYHEGYWLSCNHIIELPRFKTDINLDVENLKLLHTIKSTNSVAIHIRRGDYTNINVQQIYGGVCTLEYYQKAIEIIKNKVERPSFYFFSDDSQYVKDTFHLDNMFVVDNNVGEKSFFDLYLMSSCKYMIIANSTFSCWAAYLNNHVLDVICPHKWFANGILPDIYKENWIRI